MESEVSRHATHVRRCSHATQRCSHATQRCSQITAKGTLCKNRVHSEGEYCKMHGRFEETTCAICHDRILPTDRPTKCGHMLHTTCLQRWLSEQFTCPVCRTILKKSKHMSMDELRENFVTWIESLRV